MITIDTVLMLSAVACFVASACGVASRVNLTAAGLAAWAIAILTP